MTTLQLPAGMQINAAILPGFETILTPAALELVVGVHRFGTELGRQRHIDLAGNHIRQAAGGVRHQQGDGFAGVSLGAHGASQQQSAQQGAHATKGCVHVSTP